MGLACLAAVIQIFYLIENVAGYDVSIAGYF